MINIYTSIVFNIKPQEIRMCNDAGRLIRPILRVKDNNVIMTNSIATKIKNNDLNWNDLLTDCNIPDSVIEYIDPEEQSYSMIAMKPNELYKSNQYIYRYTHCEIHPSTIFGILASCIPFPDHNQSPRNTYQSAMGKQAMGVYVTNFDTRMDKTAYVLTYPARPLVDTRLMGMVKLDKIPAGAPVIVAIMTHSGYNQEDSLLFNQGSIDRGLFQATIYHTEKDEDKKIIKYEDLSRTFRTNEESYVDKNFIDRNGDGYSFAKVRVRTVRRPVIGDKFSSRHGQKGTIGNIIPECDMPFTSAGVKPDIIINPHAIPSRMTIGQLKETLLGKVLVELGLFGDGTSFGDLSIDTICKELTKVGYESNGDEVMYNGLSGEQIETSIFIGPVFYQRLKHMVRDKQHSRSIGPMVNLTRQPAEGRSRDGGLRCGEMERDCMVSHGASRFTRGRLYDASDKYQVHVCKRCGMVAAYNNKMKIHICNTCDNRVDFNYVEIPYACKLLFQELQTMNIAPRIMT